MNTHDRAAVVARAILQTIAKHLHDLEPQIVAQLRDEFADIAKTTMNELKSDE